MDALPELGPLPGPPLPALPPLPPEAPVVLETLAGAHDLGAPTVDSDADGDPDTAVLTAGPADGTLVLATDLDGDHRVDVVTTVDAAGRAVTATADADGRFGSDPALDPAPGPLPGPPPDPALAGGPGEDTAGDRDAAWLGARLGAGAGAPPPAPTIDPDTGAWTREPVGPGRR